MWRDLLQVIYHRNRKTISALYNNFEWKHSYVYNTFIFEFADRTTQEKMLCLKEKKEGLS